MIDLLHSLSDLPPALAWLIFLVENALLTAIALYIGNIFLRKSRPAPTGNANAKASPGTAIWDRLFKTYK